MGVSETQTEQDFVARRRAAVRPGRETPAGRVPILAAGGDCVVDGQAIVLGAHVIAFGDCDAFDETVAPVMEAVQRA
jgi:hypothetical protein